VVLHENESSAKGGRKNENKSEIKNHIRGGNFQFKKQNKINH